MQMKEQMTDTYLYSIADLKGLVENHILSKLSESQYTVEKVDPRTLMSSLRIDIGFRTLYLKLFNCLPRFADEVYYYELRAQTSGLMMDPDNHLKGDFETFKKVFAEISDEIKVKGFNPGKTLIPISIDGAILNGGHRLSAALFYKKDVFVVKTKLPSICCDYKYFLERAVPRETIEAAVGSFISYSSNVFMVFLWSSGSANWDEAEGLFRNIIYKKDINLTFQGALNLLHECYSHMSWVGDSRNNYFGLNQKRLECFPEVLSARVLIVQEKLGLNQIVEIKKKIREINGLGYSSVHITDTHEEVIKLSGILLNSNGFHFLNHSNFIDQSVHDRLCALKADMNRDNVSPEDVVIDGSFVLELYGIRKANDIDILVADFVGLDKLTAWERHDKELCFHEKSKIELIYNPICYFWVGGIKVISLQQAIIFKKNRGEKKDILDVKSAKALLTENVLRRLSSKFVQECFYFRLKTKQRMVNGFLSILIFFGVYEIVRSIWRRLKGWIA